MDKDAQLMCANVCEHASSDRDSPEQRVRGVAGDVLLFSTGHFLRFCRDMGADDDVERLPSMIARGLSASIGAKEPTYSL